MRTQIMALLAGVLALAGSAWAAQAPSYDQSPFAICGLGLMFGREHPNWESWNREATALKDAGINWIRCDFWWGVVEPEKGKFDWSYSDKMAAFYKENGISVLPILCYGSSWYGKPPDNDEERAAYANYVYQVVSRYKDTFRVWEIWNEPNIPSLWKYPNVEHYTLLLKEAYKAAKRADPTCTVLGASANGPDLTWIKGIYDHGGWDYCDAISVHPYTMGGDPVQMRLDKILRILNGFIAGTGKPKPLWITEMGWTAERPRQEYDQAVNLVQSYVISMANGVEKLFWFCANDFNEKWGITRGLDPLSPKLAYKAYKVMSGCFGSPGPAAKFEAYVKTAEGVAGYIFKKADNSRVLVFWNNGVGYKTAEMPRQTGLSAVDIFGNPVSIGNGSLTVGRTPVFVTGADARVIDRMGKGSNPMIDPKSLNLVDNPSVDSSDGKGAPGWQAGRFHHREKDATYAVSSLGRNGSTCVSISKSGSPAAWDNHLIPVFPGAKYRMTGWVKTKDATGESCIALVWYRGEGWGIVSEARSKSIAATQDWTKVSVEGVVPADSCFLRPNLISENNSGTAWFDDIEVIEE